jgi:ribonuclease VapC
MTGVVLDASALVALLRREPGWEKVEAMLDGAVISTVNLAEVVGFLARKGATEEAIRAVLTRVAIERADFDDQLALHAGLLEPLTRAAGLSLGDRACLALADRLGLPAITTDRAWAGVAESVGVPVHVIR